jgi:hypothetical protein
VEEVNKNLREENRKLLDAVNFHKTMIQDIKGGDSVVIPKRLLKSGNSLTQLEVKLQIYEA